MGMTLNDQYCSPNLFLLIFFATIDSFFYPFSSCLLLPLKLSLQLPSSGPGTPFIGLLTSLWSNTFGKPAAVPLEKPRLVFWMMKVALKKSLPKRI